MDIDKLFKWNGPSGKLPSKEEDGDHEERDQDLSKRARVEDFDEAAEHEASVGENDEYVADEDDEDRRFFGGGLTEEQTQILQIMNRNGEESIQETTAESLLADTRKQFRQLESALKQNQQMRARYPDEPAKFISSEANLHEELRQLVILTTNCALLYPEFLRMNGASLLVELLSHENADIAGAVIQVIEELTDDDVLDDNETDETIKQAGLQAMDALVTGLREQQILPLLVSNLGRFNDRPPANDDLAALENYDSDVQGVFHTLSVLENFVSLQQDCAEDIIANTPLLSWLLERIQYKAFDQNMAHAGELLAILLQDSEENRSIFGQSNGFDALLKVLAVYRKRDPIDQEEIEFMENTFDALASALLYDANKSRFLAEEGVELMALILRAKQASQLRALKVLDLALAGQYGSPQCERFVESLGLKSLFAIFMLPVESGKKARGHAIRAQDMEHVLGIMASLLHNLASDNPLRMRVLAKFVEKDYAKIDRLIELRGMTLGWVQRTERSIRDEQRLFQARGMDEESIAELAYLRRLETGLYSLQLIDYLIAWLLMEDDGAQLHIRMLLKRYDLTLEAVIATLEEYRDNLGDALVAGGNDEEGMRTQDIVQALLEYIKSL
ncbi:hypothetical protein MPSI1_001670 [Malassezia psittaci]|uniref:Beta-catenin-like protein 1 N-terminal domain-containing protein n=1 Tax=Malassezia psittaci TaxID=1821823 RepID=A0AAF0JE43_9BASI|nr:hypothetical protein MPSI1_001670 [Malassezia psittaci]